MNPTEIVAALCGMIAVVLVIRRSVWNYPFGLVSVALYVEVFFTARLYSDVLLQLYLFAMQLYGWWHWGNHRDDEGRVHVQSLRARSIWLWIAATLVMVAALGFVMHRYTDAVLPWWDAAIAGLSISGQILQARRYIQCWPVWLVTNSIAVVVYASRDLNMTALLFAIYWLLSIAGWIGWRRRAAAA
jgi:nicotinamide mononucleotide transporter